MPHQYVSTKTIQDINLYKSRVVNHLLSMSSTLFVLDLNSMQNIYPDGTTQFPNYPMTLRKWGIDNSVSVYRFSLKNNIVSAVPICISVEIGPFSNELIIPQNHGSMSGWLDGKAKTAIVYYIKGNGEAFMINIPSLRDYIGENRERKIYRDELGVRLIETKSVNELVNGSIAKSVHIWKG